MYAPTPEWRDFDPYRTLQLHPRAPRDLIIAVYWQLVSRTRRSDARSPTAADVSSAYALLMDEERRHQYDRDCQFDVEELGSSHYATLRVDECADSGIIDAAHSFLVRHGQQLKRTERHAMEDAYRLLANQNLRAQYDAGRRMIGTVPREEREAAIPALAGRPHISPSRADGKRRGIFMRKPGEATPDAKDARLLGLRNFAIASMPDLATNREDELAFAVNTTGEIVFIEGSQAGLRVPIDGAPIAIGSATCRRVRADDVTRADDVVVWQRGHRFMLREGDDAPVLVGGRRPALPVVVLDDGDEILHGSQRMRFRYIPGD